MSDLFLEMDDLILRQGLSNVFYEVAFENCIRKGTRIYAVDTTSYFSMELDTIEDFKNACEKIPAHLL